MSPLRMHQTNASSLLQQLLFKVIAFVRERELLNGSEYTTMCDMRLLSVSDMRDRHGYVSGG